MSSTPYNWELLTEHAAFSPRDTSEGNEFFKEVHPQSPKLPQ